MIEVGAGLRFLGLRVRYFITNPLRKKNVASIFQKEVKNNYQTFILLFVSIILSYLQVYYRFFVSNILTFVVWPPKNTGCPGAWTPY